MSCCCVAEKNRRVSQVGARAHRTQPCLLKEQQQRAAERRNGGIWRGISGFRGICKKKKNGSVLVPGLMTMMMVGEKIQPVTHDEEAHEE